MVGQCGPETTSKGDFSLCTRSGVTASGGMSDRTDNATGTPVAGAFHEAESEILKFASSDCGPTQVADGVTVDFPLRHFKGLESADSRVEEDLQLSDILAGGAVCAAKSLFAPTGDNEYGRRVMDLYNEFPIDRWLFRPCAVMSDFSGEISWILAHIRK